MKKMQKIERFEPGIVPVGPRLVVFPEPVEEITKGGIALPVQIVERDEMKQIEAVVISIGKEAFRDVHEPWCKPGDEILMAKYAGVVWVGQDGLKYRIILDSDVMACRQMYYSDRLRDSFQELNISLDDYNDGKHPVSVDREHPVSVDREHPVSVDREHPGIFANREHPRNPSDGPDQTIIPIGIDSAERFGNV